jgi:hypothetical protein
MALTERQQDQTAAMALVTASQHAPSAEAAKASKGEDLDLKRAKDLVAFHSSVRSVSAAEDDQLQTDRDNVRKAIDSL